MVVIIIGYGKETVMNNNLNSGKKKKRLYRMVLGVVFSLLFALCADIILWAIGALGTTITIKYVILLNLIFVSLIVVILWAIGFCGKGKE